MNINPYTKGLFISILLPDTSCLAFSIRFQGMLKGNKKLIRRDKISKELDLYIAEILELSDQGSKML